jgi:hypothetical protein
MDEILQWFDAWRHGFFRFDMGGALMDYTQLFICD